MHLNITPLELGNRIHAAAERLAPSFGLVHESDDSETFDPSTNNAHAFLLAVCTSVVQGDSDTFPASSTQDGQKVFKTQATELSKALGEFDSEVEREAHYKGVHEGVMKVISEQWGHIKDIKTCTRLSDFVDSLDTVELVMALEDEFKVEIPDEDAERHIPNLNMSTDALADNVTKYLVSRGCK